jgi:8-oxo-dGTP diphosphatase
MNKGSDYIGVSVTYFCHDGKGNFLFNKRSQNCRDEKGRWDCGGGGLEFGDTVEDRLRKEIKEEYCTDIISYEFLGYNDIHRSEDGKNTHWIGLIFKVRVDREKVYNGEPHKFDEIGWFKLSDLPQPLHSQMQGEIDEYREKLEALS